MVSIAESLNYRIFERKWRPGEALNGLPRACRILSVEQKPNLTKEPWFVESPRLFGDRVVTPSPRHNVDSWVIQFYWTSALPPGARLEQQTQVCLSK